MYFRADERGYQGWLVGSLESTYRELGLLDQGQIVQQENQKIRALHRTTQRPDIIVHFPRADDTTSAAKKGNMAAYELKNDASPRGVKEDLLKLDRIIRKMHYCIGFFVNIRATRAGMHEWGGIVNNRIHAFAPRLVDSGVEIHHEWFRGPGNDPAFETLEPDSPSSTWPSFEALVRLRTANHPRS
jgi:hypothetical protein